MSGPGTKRPGRVRVAAACSRLVTMLMIAERISSAHPCRSVEGIPQVSRDLMSVMRNEYRHKSKTLTVPLQLSIDFIASRLIHLVDLSARRM